MKDSTNTIAKSPMDFSLPQCDMRVETQTDLFYCRHDRVRAPNNRVSSDTCIACTAKNTRCENPRANEPTPLQEPGLIRTGLNAMRSFGAFVGDRGRLVSDAVFDARMAICEACDHKIGNKCAHCGCNLRLKARGRVFNCPLEKWPEVPED